MTEEDLLENVAGREVGTSAMLTWSCRGYAEESADRKTAWGKMSAIRYVLQHETCLGHGTMEILPT